VVADLPLIVGGGALVKGAKLLPVLAASPKLNSLVNTMAAGGIFGLGKFAEEKLVGEEEGGIKEAAAHAGKEAAIWGGVDLAFRGLLKGGSKIALPIVKAAINGLKKMKAGKSASATERSAIESAAPEAQKLLPGPKYGPKEPGKGFEMKDPGAPKVEGPVDPGKGFTMEPPKIKGPEDPSKQFVTGVEKLPPKKKVYDPRSGTEIELAPGEKPPVKPGRPVELKAAEPGAPPPEVPPPAPAAIEEEVAAKAAEKITGSKGSIAADLAPPPTTKESFFEHIKDLNKSYENTGIQSRFLKQDVEKVAPSEERRIAMYLNAVYRDNWALADDLWGKLAAKNPDAWILKHDILGKAKALSESESNMVDKVLRTVDEIGTIGEGAGILTKQQKTNINYLPQYVRRTVGKLAKKLERAEGKKFGEKTVGFAAKPGEAKERVFRDGPLEAMINGYEPVMDIGGSAASYAMNVNKSVAERRLVDALMKATTEGGDALLVKGAARDAPRH